MKNIFKAINCLKCCSQERSGSAYNLQTISRSSFKINQTELDTNSLSIGNRDDTYYLKEILKTIETNKSIGLLKECPRFTQLKQKDEFKIKIEKINSEIISNNENFNQFPSDYSYCLIANHCYCFQTQNESKKSEPNSDLSIFTEDDNIHTNIIWHILSASNWIIYEQFRFKGFKSIVYLNEETKQIVLAYQGMKLNLNDYLLNNINLKIKHYINLISSHSNALYFHVKKCIDLSERIDYSLSFTGYSFGALLADLSVLISHKYFNKKTVKSVTFESFGSFKLLNELNDTINLKDLDLKTFLFKPNFFNTMEKHIGQVIYVPNSCNKLNESSLLAKLIKSHSMPHLNDFYLNGFKSLCSINLKYLLINIKKDLKEVTKWPVNFSLNADQGNIHIVLNDLKDLLENNELLVPTLERITLFNYEYLKQTTEITQKLKANNLIESLDDTVIFKTINPFEKEFDLNDLHLQQLKELKGLDEDDLMWKQLSRLRNKYEIETRENVSIWITTKITRIDLLMKQICRLEGLYPDLRQRIEELKREKLEKTVDIDSEQINPTKKLLNRLNEEFLALSEHILNKKTFSDALNSNLDFDNRLKRLIIISAQTASGKMKLAVKYVGKLLDLNDKLIIRIIDASTWKNIYFDMTKLRLELDEPFDKDELIDLKYYYKPIKRIKEPEGASFVIILKNLNSFHNFNKEINMFFSSITTYFITCDSRQDFSSFRYHNYLPYRIDCINLKEFDLKKYIELFDNDMFRIYEVDNRIDLDRKINESMTDYLRNFALAKTGKIKYILAMLNKRTDWSRDEFYKFANNTTSYIQEENETAFHFLKSISFLDGNYLSFDLLKSLYEKLNGNDTNLHAILNYLSEYLILNKISTIKYTFYESVRLNLIENLGLKFEETSVLIGTYLDVLLKIVQEEKEYSPLDYNFEVCCKQFFYLRSEQKGRAIFLNKDKYFELYDRLFAIWPSILYEFEIGERSVTIYPYEKVYETLIESSKIKVNEIFERFQKSEETLIEHFLEVGRLAQLHKEQLIASIIKSFNIDIKQDDELPDDLKQRIELIEHSSENMFQEIDNYEKKCRRTFENNKDSVLEAINDLRDLIASTEENWSNGYYYGSIDRPKVIGYLDHLDMINLYEFKRLYFNVNRLIWPDGLIEFKEKINEIGRIQYVRFRQPNYQSPLKNIKLDTKHFKV